MDLSKKHWNWQEKKMLIHVLTFNFGITIETELTQAKKCKSKLVKFPSQKYNLKCRWNFLFFFLNIF